MAGDKDAVTSFIVDPQGFASNNLIRVSTGLATSGFGAIDKVTLIDCSNQASATHATTGKACGTYILKMADANEKNVIDAYICNYSRGQIEYQFLGTIGAFCFTIAMDGCTFGIGSANGRGGVLVSHANASGKATSRTEQTQMQRDMSQAGGRDGVTLLEPADYRPANEMVATTFGVRSGATWSFYTHTYKVVKKGFPTGYEVQGCTKFA